MNVSIALALEEPMVIAQGRCVGPRLGNVLYVVHRITYSLSPCLSIGTYPTSSHDQHYFFRSHASFISSVLQDGLLSRSKMQRMRISNF